MPKHKRNEKTTKGNTPISIGHEQPYTGGKRVVIDNRQARRLLAKKGSLSVDFSTDNSKDFNLSGLLTESLAGKLERITEEFM